MMPILTILRGMSNVVEHLVVRSEGEGHPTARWQDKSRKVRRGRVPEEFKCINHLARGATEPHSFPIGTTHWKLTTTRTSRPPAL